MKADIALSIAASGRGAFYVDCLSPMDTAWRAIRDPRRPIERPKTINPQVSVAEAVEMSAQDDVNQLPVVAIGRIKGVISRHRVMQFLITRAELEM